MQLGLGGGVVLGVAVALSTPRSLERERSISRPCRHQPVDKRIQCLLCAAVRAGGLRAGCRGSPWARRLAGNQAYTQYGTPRAVLGDQEHCVCLTVLGLLPSALPLDLTFWLFLGVCASE